MLAEVSGGDVVIALLALFGVVITALSGVTIARVTNVHREVKTGNGATVGVKVDRIENELAVTRQTLTAVQNSQYEMATGLERVEVGIQRVEVASKAHDLDDERRFIRIFEKEGLPVEEAQSRARQIFVDELASMEERRRPPIPTPVPGKPSSAS